MKTLVIGGTGTVGAHIVRSPALTNHSIRVMSRVSDNLVGLPSNAQGCIGDLARSSSLKQAMDGADQVFLTTPLSENESKLGLNGVKIAQESGIKRIVYLSVLMPEGSEHIPHFASKIPIEQAIKKSGIPYTILRPNIFFQNDFWCEAAIMLYNVYPQPIGNKGINSIDARDVADAAVNALTSNEFENRTYNLHGPETLTAQIVASIFAKALEKDVYYTGGNLEEWSKQARHMMPVWMVDDLKIMYQYCQEYGFIATASELQSQEKILGHEPRSFKKFVAEVVPNWLEEHQPV